MLAFVVAWVAFVEQVEGFVAVPSASIFVDSLNMG